MWVNTSKCFNQFYDTGRKSSSGIHHLVRGQRRDPERRVQPVVGGRGQVLELPGLNFTNILRPAFTGAAPKSTKRYWQLDWILTLLGSVCVNMLMTLTTGVNFINILWGAFLYESVLCSSSSLIRVLPCIFCARKLVKKLFVKCWWNWLQGSISPTFYKQLLCMQIPKVQKHTDDLTV